MQAIAPVTVADLVAPVQRMRYKLEVYDGGVWRDLTALGGEDYLKSVSVSLGGAGPTADPIAGSWSATLDNHDSLFHPLHPTSPWAGLLRIGREVRISIGGNYGAGVGVDYYWQRIIGFMDAPRFDHGGKTVEISGLDYTKLLADTVLRDANPVSESGSPWASGSFSGALDDVINGPLRWGRVAVFDAVASPGGSGAELYVEGDACEIGAGEGNNIGAWATSGSGEVLSSVPSTQSNWALQLARSGPGPNEQYGHLANVTALTAGQPFVVKFKARIAAGTNYAKVFAYETIGGAPVQVGFVSFADSSWAEYSIVFTPTVGGNLQLRLTTSGKYATEFDLVEIDEISARLYNPDSWMNYDLPDFCRGPYSVTLDGEPVGQGDQDAEVGWHYDEATRVLSFTEGMTVNAGTANLRVYYYTDQLLDNVLADILVWAGLYATRAAALADLDYVPTGVTLGRVWFEPKSTALAAVAKICERVNYRFWFAFDGQPCFQPAPVADAIDFTFTDPGHLQNIAEYQDASQVKNRVIIEGAERAMFQTTRDDKADDKYKGEASDPASIATYLEQTWSISNHLFQNQTSVNWIAALILSESHDPKWYADLGLFANPVPLELGDVVAWEAELEPSDIAESGSGAVIVSMMGIIRDIKINNAQATYRVEVAEEFWSTGMLPSGSPPLPSGSPSGPVSGLPSGSPSGFLVEEVFDFGTEGDEDEAWVVPTGVNYIEAEAWGPGGVGGPAGPAYSDIGGGGGGGGAYSRSVLAVTPGETLDLHFPATGPDDAEVYRGSICLLRAQHGTAAVDQMGATGGDAAAGVGDIRHSGGKGADVFSDDGGGGGSSAGTGSDGNDAHDINGASAPAGGGAGGDGGVPDANGDPGTTPGGGGGGAGYDVDEATVGGVGGYGRIKISYWS